MTLRLTRGDFILDLAPNLGGSVTRFSLGEHDILRRAISDKDARDTSAFSMVPFSGRIANGCFSTNDETVQLPPNMPPEPHAIHGFGWQTAWDVKEQTSDSAVLVHRGGKAWPWQYTATQVFQLTATGLQLTLNLQNNSEKNMPAGLGWHPYFNRQNAKLTADTTHVWLSGDDMIPSPPVIVPEDMDLRQTRHVDELHLDYAFNVGATVQTFEWPNLKLVQTADPIFQNLIVYVPKGENFFCVEPATHAPDAVNAALGDDVTGLKWLAKGETLRGTIMLDISPTSL